MDFFYMEHLHHIERPDSCSMQRKHVMVTVSSVKLYRCQRVAIKTLAAPYVLLSGGLLHHIRPSDREHA
jgi:hypothetical protein